MQNNNLVKEIQKEIAQLKESGVQVARNEGADDSYHLTGRNFFAEIVLNPERWIGLKITALGSGRKKVEFEIDTDAI